VASQRETWIIIANHNLGSIATKWTSKEPVKIGCGGWRKRERLILRKSHRRNPDALDYERYMLVDERNGVAAHGTAGEWLTLDEVEEWLND